MIDAGPHIRAISWLGDKHPCPTGLQGEGDGWWTNLPRASSASGAISLRLPQALHAALMNEAEQEGVSLNQLCLAKLAVQLREAVSR